MIQNKHTGNLIIIVLFCPSKQVIEIQTERTKQDQNYGFVSTVKIYE